MYLSQSLNISLNDVDVFIGEGGIVAYNITIYDYDTANATTTSFFQNRLNNMGGSGISVNDVQLKQNIVAKTVGNYWFSI